MKRNLTLAIICSVALAGCSAVKDTDQTVSDNVSDTYHDVKQAAVATGAVVQAGADEAIGHAENTGNAAKDGYYQATDHIADWMRPSVPKPPQPIAASYCYHVYQDILCYRRPMPGWETRLAGYQPITADPPPAAQMQPLAQHAQDASQLPVHRVAASKPVFTQLPSQAADVKPAEDAGTPAASEASHEQLPDPALAPQL